MHVIDFVQELKVTVVTMVTMVKVVVLLEVTKVNVVMNRWEMNVELQIEGIGGSMVQMVKVVDEQVMMVMPMMKYWQKRSNQIFYYACIDVLYIVRTFTSSFAFAEA